MTHYWHTLPHSKKSYSLLLHFSFIYRIAQTEHAKVIICVLAFPSQCLFWWNWILNWEIQPMSALHQFSISVHTSEGERLLDDCQMNWQTEWESLMRQFGQSAFSCQMAPLNSHRKTVRASKVTLWPFGHFLHWNLNIYWPLKDLSDSLHVFTALLLLLTINLFRFFVHRPLLIDTNKGRK